MDELPVIEISPFVQVGTVIFIAASMATCVAVSTWFARGQFAPYEPRRRVPWEWFDLIAVIAFFISLSTVVSWVDSFRVVPTSDQPTLGSEKDLGVHPLVVLVRDSYSPQTFLLVAVTAVIVAPLFEEFLIRLLFQGWLESMETRWRRWLPGLRWLTRGVLPIGVASLLFGAMHYRPNPIDKSAEELIHVISRLSLIELLTLPLAMLFLRHRSGATLEDLGIVPGKFFHDVGLGLITFLAVIVPIFSLRYVLIFFLPENPIVDPITLFLFALALGILYYRTHRIVPAITLHMTLNATTLAMMWYFTTFQENGVRP